MAKQPKQKTKNIVEKAKTIIVTDPKDKRLKAYHDSLASYNKNENLWKDYKPLTPSTAQQIGTSYQSGLVYKKRNNPNLSGYDVVVKDVVKKPVQPYKLEKKKPVSKSPVKTETKLAPKEITKPAPKTILKEEKKLYQGRQFMDSTGLRPNFYTKSEIINAVNNKIKKK